jgi:hypothetical protein
MPYTVHELYFHTLTHPSQRCPALESLCNAGAYPTNTDLLFTPWNSGLERVLWWRVPWSPLETEIEAVLVRCGTSRDMPGLQAAEAEVEYLGEVEVQLNLLDSAEPGALLALKDIRVRPCTALPLQLYQLYVRMPQAPQGACSSVGVLDDVVLTLKKLNQVG